MLKKILFSLAVSLIALSGIFSSLTYASSQTNNSGQNDFTQEEINQVADELEFYFEEVGQIDQNGNYSVHNYDLLLEKAESGDETAQALVQQINQAQPASATDYAQCILADYFGTEIALLQGDLVDAVVSEIQSGSWQAAAEIILISIGDTAGKANIVATATQLALAASTCSSELFN